MTHIIQNAKAGSTFGPSITMNQGIVEGVRCKGLWHLSHLRPVDDANLRRAREFCETQAALNRAGFLGKMKLLRDLRRIGAIAREEIHAEDFPNLVVNAGLDELLDVGLSHAATTTNWYVGLKDTGAPAAGDTMASHAGWATISPYSNGTDPEWVDAGVSGQSVDNSASTADFNCDATDEVFGAFLKDDSTVDVATGLLYAAGNFGASRNVQNGDTLKVTATFTAS